MLRSITQTGNPNSIYFSPNFFFFFFLSNSWVVEMVMGVVVMCNNGWNCVGCGWKHAFGSCISVVAGRGLERSSLLVRDWKDSVAISV